MDKTKIEEMESTLDNVAHELMSTEYLSEEGYKKVVDAYYTFRDKLHDVIHEDYPDEEFINF